MTQELANNMDWPNVIAESVGELQPEQSLEVRKL